MSVSHYFFELFKTNHFTWWFFLWLLALTFFKVVPFPLRLSTRNVLAAVVFLGLFLRLAWLGFSSYTPLTTWNSQHMLESDVTNVHAIELTQGIWFHWSDGMPEARRPIGYPMLLALAYKLFGANLWVAYTLNLLLYVLAALLLFLITKLIFSERIALLAAFFFSVWPVSIYSIKLITDEHLFLPLWYFGLYLLLREVKGSKIRWPLFWYGLIFGYATMTRTHSIFMPFVVAFAYFLVKRPWKKIVFAFFAVAILMQAVNLPWVIRNYSIWKVVVPYTLTGYGLYTWVNGNATAEMPADPPKKGESGYSEELDQAIQAKDVGLQHQYGAREMRRWILGHPLQFLKLGTGRVLVFVGWNRAGGVWPIWHQYYPGSFDPKRPIAPAVREFFEETAFAFYYILLFSFIFSVVFLVRRWEFIDSGSRACAWVLGACLFFWLAGQMVIFADRKYRYPLEPLMMIPVSFFYDFLLHEFRWEKIAPRWTRVKNNA